MQDWLVLAFISSVFLALVSILSKKLTDSFNEYAVAFLINFLTIPFLWLIVFIAGIPLVDVRFWFLIAAIMPIEVITAILFFRAFKVGKLSEVIPITSIFPFTVAVGAYIFLGESLKPLHLIAVALLGIGAYVLNLEGRISFLAPFKKLLSNRGVQLMLAVGVLIAITVPLGKTLSQYSSSQFYAAVYFSLLTICLFPIAIFKGSIRFNKLSSSYRLLALLGLLNAGFIFTFWKASSDGNLSIVNALRTLNVLFSVGLSSMILREKVTKKQFIGAILMVLGAVLVVA